MTSSCLQILGEVEQQVDISLFVDILGRVGSLPWAETNDEILILPFEKKLF